jgi:hypothetical protein
MCPTFPLAHPSKDLIILMEVVQIVKDSTFQCPANFS